MRFSRRILEQLGSLQAAAQEAAAQRNCALRNFRASRNATTPAAQREFWLEFSWADQEYRSAVRRLAEFCARHGALKAPVRRTPEEFNSSGSMA